MQVEDPPKERAKSGPKPKKRDAPETIPVNPGDQIQPPNWLDRYGRKEWFTYIDELQSDGIVNTRTALAFGQLCLWLGTIERCSEIIDQRSKIKPDRKGNGDSAVTSAYGSRPIPEIKLMMQAQDRAFKLMDKFRMMPGKAGAEKAKGKKANGIPTSAEARRLRLFGVSN